MSQVDIPFDLASAYINVESSFGTAGATWVRMFPVQGTFKVTREQEQLAVERLRVKAHDSTVPVQGRKGAKVSFDVAVAPHQTLLTSGASLPTDDYVQVLLKHFFGGCSHAVGTTVNDVTPADDNCTFTSGTVVPDGQMFAVNTSAGYQTCKTILQSGTSVTWYPDTSVAPADAAVVRNLVTYYLEDTSSTSLSLRFALAGDSNMQFECNGGVASIEFKFGQGSLLTMSVSIDFATYSGPSALSISVADAQDPLADPFSVVNSELLIQGLSTTTRTGVTCDSFSVKFAPSKKHTETLTGGIQGKRSVVRSADLEKSFAQLEITMSSDRDFDTYYANKTPLYVRFQATNSDSRFASFEFARCFLVAVPDHDRGGDKLSKMKLMLQADRDRQCTATTNLATTPARIALG